MNIQIGWLVPMTIIFVVLLLIKVTLEPTLSWWWVTLPLWWFPALALVLGVLFFLGIAGLWFISRDS